MLLALLPTAVLAAFSTPLALSAVLALLPVYLIKGTILGIPITLLEVLLLGTVLGGVVSMLRQRVRPTFGGPFTFPVLALIAVWVASSLLSPETRAGLGALKAWLVEPVLLAWLAVTLRGGERARWIMLWGLVVGSVAPSLYGIIEKLGGFGLPPDGRLNSVFVPANYHAMLVAPVLAMVLALLPSVRGRTRVLLAAAAGVFGLGLLLTASYGAFLGVGVAALVILSTLPMRARRFALLGLAIVAAVALASQLGSEKFHLLGKLNERSSSSVRVQIWHSAVRITEHHPWLGVGPNAFEIPYRETVAILYWPPLEWLVAQPHNLYLALASETGLFGLAAFAWLLAVWWRVAIRSTRALGSRSWALASLAAVTVILVHGLVDTPVLKNDLAVLFAFALVLPLVGRAEAQSAENKTRLAAGFG